MIRRGCTRALGLVAAIALAPHFASSSQPLNHGNDPPAEFVLHAERIWTGDVEHPVTLHLINRADILLRTTKFDGDAIAVREALFLETPVIATAVVPVSGGSVQTVVLVDAIRADATSDGKPAAVLVLDDLSP